ncbi:putative reverse transcriptase domain-containing protein [Tanacetum coccineum]
MTNTRFGMTPVAIEEMINQRVDASLEARWVNRDLGLGNGNDNRGGDGNRNNTGNGNNRGDNGDGNENRNVNGRGDRPGALECTYQDFMKCQPLSFKGTEGVVGLIRWSEKMETVFHISNCPERYQVKYVTYTLLDSALSWWNSHKRTIGTVATYALSWRELLKLMTEVYCPRNEIQKMETELWNLSVKNNDMTTYIQRFQELTMMYTKMVPEEEDWVEKFIRGLPDNIQGNVIAAEPTRLQDAVQIANHLMDKKLKGYAVRNAESKRRLDNNYRDNRVGCTTKDSVLLSVITDITGRIVPNSRTKIVNKARVPDARGKAYVLGGGDANPGSNIVTGDKSDKEKKSTLSIISCVKAQKYMEKGCQLFLAQVTMKENKDESKEKRLEDVPTVRDFPEVFPEDLPGLPPTRQVEFQIDLVLGAAPVARAPC